jgi:hypothetical protein
MIDNFPETCVKWFFLYRLDGGNILGVYTLEFVLPFFSENLIDINLFM